MFLRRINVKFTLVLVGAFLLGAGLLYALTVFSLVRSLRQEDHTALRVRLLQYWAQYELDGLSAVVQRVQDERFLPGDPLHFVRIADSGNRTRVFRAAAEFAPLERELASSDRVRGLESIEELQAPGYAVPIEVAALRLGDGVVLQVGSGTENRIRVLGVISRNFMLSAILIVVVSALAGIALTARMLRPLERLNTAVRAIIDTGNISGRIETRADGDELDALSASFNEMLERIERLVGGMKATLDTVAHDFRTPLTRLRGIAEVALRGPQDAERYREALSDCLEEAEQMVRLLNAIMDISEVEAGVMKLELEPTDLAGLAAEVVELYRYAAEEREIVLRVTVGAADAGSGATTAPLDRARFRQAIANLLDNAVKYGSPGGTVAVTVGMARPAAAAERSSAATPAGTASERSRLVLEVLDDGIGIPANEVPHIWERLYRGSEVRYTRGLGLGLSLVHAIVAAHGGSVAVESTPGVGSRFRIELPTAGEPSSAGS